MKISEIFLRAKHWQIFSLTTFLPIATILAVAWWIQQHRVTVPYYCGATSKLEMILYAAIPLIIIIPSITLLGWLWSVTVGLQNRQPETVRMKTLWFKVFFFTPLVTIALFILGMTYGRELADLIGSSFHIALVILFHSSLAFLGFSVIAIPYFVAQSLKIAEKESVSSFSKFAKEYFLILFFPIGIWFLQPRVNQTV
ncbi:MAG: hypothetical protein AAF740_11760 [Bacteroidota bacterium]